jgi:hypothetical protein
MATTGCEDESSPSKPSDTPVTLNSVTANGSDTETTTQLTLTFSAAITGLSASNITLTAGDTGATKGELTGTGPTYTLAISGVTDAGTLTVAVAKSGYAISGSPKTAAINYVAPSTPVTLSSVNADGDANTTTTQLTLTFNAAITGLSAADITLTAGSTGAAKGTLTGTGPVYTLPITGVTAGGEVSVAVAKSGYTISGSPKTVTIYFASGGGGNQTPVTGDYDITGLTPTYDGSAKAVTVTAKSGKSTGAVTVNYTPAGGTASATAPTNAGTYAVTFNVAAATGWNAATNLSAGNLVISAKSISGVTIDAIANQPYTGNAITPTVVVKDGSTTLASPASYSVNITNNINAGQATVTITGAGNYTGTKTANFNIKRQPAYSDYDISGLGVFVNNVSPTGPKAVTVTAKTDGVRSPGAVTVYYAKDGGAPAITAPENDAAGIGAYTVTFDVAASGDWFGATIEAGKLEIIAEKPGYTLPSNVDFDIQNLGPFKYDVNAPVTREVTITPNSGKSQGTRIVYYNGQTAAPKLPGTYTVTFDVDWDDTNKFYPQTGLSAGTLIIQAPAPGSGFTLVWVDSHGSLVASGETKVDKGETLTITAAAGTKPVRWGLDGVKVQDGGDTYNFRSWAAGRHNVTLLVEDTSSGKLFNTNIVITVTP